MKTKITAAASALAMLAATPMFADVLPSWSDAGTKSAIVDFVGSVTDKASSDYLAPEDRIAVFDNDGTLWTEKPTYTEVVFALNQVEDLVARRPELATQEPFSIILEKGLGSLKEIGLRGAIAALTAVYADLDDQEFNARADAFLNEQHLKAGRTNIEATYAPMVELVDYLDANDFRVFIVSGGTNMFLRTFAETAYNVQPSRIIGSAMAGEVAEVNGEVTVQRQPELAYFNDGETKVLNVVRGIGERPTIVFGNSDGDLPMIRYALAGEGPRMGLLLTHDDDEREVAYTRGAEDAIAAASVEGDNFHLVSMKDNFTSVWQD